MVHWVQVRQKLVNTRRRMEDMLSGLGADDDAGAHESSSSHSRQALSGATAEGLAAFGSVTSVAGHAG